MSPYSSIIGNNKKNELLQNRLNSKWVNVLSRYKFLKSPKEKNIQATLFLDYFIQSIGVANRSNDLICCENSVEPRNVYIQKPILKMILNLPLKYKINFKVKDNRYRQKYLLKKIFSKYFLKKNIFKKSGFSGFPNELRSFLKKGLSKIIQKVILNNKIQLNTINRDLEWKLINSQIFIKKFF